MVVIRSFKQYYKHDILLDLALCSLSAYPKVRGCYHSPPAPEKSTQIQDGGSFYSRDWTLENRKGFVIANRTSF